MQSPNTVPHPPHSPHAFEVCLGVDDEDDDDDEDEEATNSGATFWQHLPENYPAGNNFFLGKKCTPCHPLNAFSTPTSAHKCEKKFREWSPCPFLRILSSPISIPHQYGVESKNYSIAVECIVW